MLTLKNKSQKKNNDQIIILIIFSNIFTLKIFTIAYFFNMFKVL
jgi:hypothetical protein